ncbi:hypothetical protein OPT61_g9242 [Boeremia exigua]|uniref:Uncharacterized protein n=1 Tax=Boeremia exigua TaxID=749465 RepID=A0ACC2HWI9_9PLEO|nr:hypothetical protein OPT61_g9242 [Boeremia exigua]
MQRLSSPPEPGNNTTTQRSAAVHTKHQAHHDLPTKSQVPTPAGVSKPAPDSPEQHPRPQCRFSPEWPEWRPKREADHAPKPTASRSRSPRCVEEYASALVDGRCSGTDVTGVVFGVLR